MLKYHGSDFTSDGTYYYGEQFKFYKNEIMHSKCKWNADKDCIDCDCGEQLWKHKPSPKCSVLEAPEVFETKNLAPWSPKKGLRFSVVTTQKNKLTFLQNSFSHSLQLFASKSCKNYYIGTVF